MAPAEEMVHKGVDFASPMGAGGFEPPTSRV